jgi:hypothetical protein
MNQPRNLKQFDDPLFEGLKDTNVDREQKSSRESRLTKSSGGGGIGWMAAIAFVVAVGLLGYLLYDAQERIDQLSVALTDNQEQLTRVSSDLDESQAEIEDLNTGLNESHTQLQIQGHELNRYRDLYSNLKTEQDSQTQEIRSLEIQKANQSEVNDLKGEAARLQGDLSDVSTEVSRLETISAENRSEIESNKASLSTAEKSIAEVRQSATANAGEIAAVKKSLEREYFNFELQEKGGYMKVFSVALSLKDTDVRKRQFDLYVMADGKILQKKDQSVNEPIIFYAEGKKKPYEVVVTRIDNKLVTGYLSVPKS